MKNKVIKKIIAFMLVLSILLVNNGFSIFIDSMLVYANGSDYVSDTNIGSPSIIKENLLFDGLNHDSSLFGWTGGSNVNGDNLVVSSEFEYAYLLYNGKEDKSRFYYTDDYFKNPSTIYNNHLSTMSIDLAISGVGN